MKRILLGLIAFSAVATYAQDAVVQSGTPALLEASNGKKAKVMLQRMESGNLTFQPFKSMNDMTVPADKISSLQFFPKYDAVVVTESFNSADYSAVLEVLEPLMQEFSPYMTIKNNLQEAYCMLFDAYRGMADYAQVAKIAPVLVETGDPKLIAKAKVGLAVVAIERGDFSTAERIRTELESPAAALYVKALIERAQNKPKDAIKTITTIIAEHANDQEWMPQSELLNAYLYLDMTGTNSVISTNSVINTSRQVKNMYAGSNVAGDARKLWVSLGGEKIEAEEKAAKAERAAAGKAAKEQREAAARERKAAAKAKREAEAAAKASAAASTNLNTTTENESE